MNFSILETLYTIHDIISLWPHLPSSIEETEIEFLEYSSTKTASRGSFCNPSISTSSVRVRVRVRVRVCVREDGVRGSRPAAHTALYSRPTGPWQIERVA